MELRQALVENNRNLLAIQKSFESENEAAKNRIQILENDLAESREELLRTKNELSSLSSKISKVEDSSFMMVCGYQSSSWSTLGIVHFDSIASEYNNPGNMLNISTGVFTSYTAGFVLFCQGQVKKCIN